MCSQFTKQTNKKNGHNSRNKFESNVSILIAEVTANRNGADVFIYTKTFQQTLFNLSTIWSHHFIFLKQWLCCCQVYILNINSADHNDSWFMSLLDLFANYEFHPLYQQFPLYNSMIMNTHNTLVENRLSNLYSWCGLQ